MSKCMVIVDVQREFHRNGYTNTLLFDKEYISKIKQTIKRNGITAVFFVYDCNSGEINVPNKFIELEAEYYSKRFYKNYAGYDLETINQYIEEGEATVVDEEAFLIFDQLYIKTYNAHETQCVNESLEDLVDEVRSYDKVYLCGGANGECLEDIEYVFDYFKVSYTMKNHLVYPLPVAHTELDYWEWTGIECPY